MASKVLVKIPTMPFSQVSKKAVELTVVGRSEGLLPNMSADPLLRITQLEQNIRFLQDQHQMMLASLHHEVEQLRQRNRDLQFQLVFAKGGMTLSSSPSPSSSEEDGKPKILLSPKQPNMTPLQVEILERDIAELKSALQEAKTKNLYLSGIVDEQKKKLESLESSKQELEAVGTKIVPHSKCDAENQVDEVVDPDPDPDPDMAAKLEEMQKVMRRLRRENEDQRRELATLRSNMGLGPGGRLVAASRGANHRTQHQQSQSQRFPPLHSHSYWHHGQQQHRNGLEFVSHRHCANGNNGNVPLDKDTQLVCRPAPALPNLRTNGGGYSTNANTQRRGGYYGNHYYRGTKEEGTENRKYRGGGGAGGGNTKKGTRDSKQ